MPKRQLASTGEIVDVDTTGKIVEGGVHSDGPTMQVKVYAPFKV
jgi:hypothetical protein